ncbi:Selenophosphate-dependent tRNA 2-selenouridine synthase [Candidatus Rhodobacter oscarellae]|uniref:Selenophosphate-dependent tRNA 2-selenouridine synthase n=1 Tax=Candidatus Rhodobacter oscarellae TaxID=1675527 RepID=A0A0J9E3R1_9RHOB|nr:tRNA 2-selenouridine(34) synthase MnmH [Candidatus Rhodobacter lobularis]KMW56474.1 Selenophosphate-dependent tRNA 2-selenouridine synthase [Candidatus Rhodobacter lobularis]
MPIAFDSLADIYAASFDDLIDVRSPAEFAEDHVPGAINLPALSNEERAKVGTIYTQVSPFKARKIGAALVARNAADHIEGPLAAHDGAWQPLVYCWRGGQRSGSFASILQQIGWRAETLKGGYQSYRRLVVAMLHDSALPHRLVVLDGNTGTAKTELLHRACAQGAQILDLEGLANHRGSLFGAMPGGQPAQKGFESRIAEKLTALDPARPTLVEAESSKVGELIVPPALWKAMCAAPRITVAAPLQARARYLTQAYCDMLEDPARLAATLEQLIRFQGREQVAAWTALAQQGAYETLAAELMERHYDRRYGKSRADKPQERLAEIALGAMDSADLDRAAAAICNATK